jgi:hypothetical protein
MKFGADVSDGILNGTALDFAFENFARTAVNYFGPFNLCIAISLGIKADNQLARQQSAFIIRQCECFGGDFFGCNAHQR